MIITTEPSVTQCLLWCHVQWTARAWTDNAQLQHIVEFVTSNLESFCCKTTGTCRYWWSCGGDKVGNVMLYRMLSYMHLCDRGEVTEKDDKLVVQVAWVHGGAGLEIQSSDTCTLK